MKNIIQSIITKKNAYILLLMIICLSSLVIIPTYAKFGSSYVTDDEIVGLNLSFDISISNIEEYEELIIPAGGSEKFNVQINNSTDDIVYYGIWYKMITPETLTDDIQIGRLAETTTTTSGSIEEDDSTTVTIAIVNDSDSSITINMGVVSSSTGTNDIEYLGGRKLITGEVSIPRDILITTITIDGIESSSLPTGGTYTMSSTCTKGSTLTWNTYNKNITYKSGAAIGDECSVAFTSSKEYPYLNTMEVGSYVAYTGTGGAIGSNNVVCQTNGSASSSNPDDETEAPNSCSGQNAREDLDASDYTYGYCYSANNKYYVTGWRIAYTLNGKVMLVSAGAPECNTGSSSTGNRTFIKELNSKALKYCNSDYVDGGCTCDDEDGDGLCDSASTDAWALNDTDFYYMTLAISGYGKRLTNESSSLGTTEGNLQSNYCSGEYSYLECGYTNDLIDNGGYYWFASKNSSTSSSTIFWNPYNRYVDSSSNINAYGLRPVISLSSTVVVTGGSGTIDDPYTISNVK